MGREEMNLRPYLFVRPIDFREAFTQAQLDRMQPIVGDFMDQSYFIATYYMYFPFLLCEVKCSAVALDIADY